MSWAIAGLVMAAAACGMAGLLFLMEGAAGRGSMLLLVASFLLTMMVAVAG